MTTGATWVIGMMEVDFVGIVVRKSGWFAERENISNAACCSLLFFFCECDHLVVQLCIV